MKLSASQSYIIVAPESEWKRFKLKCSRALKKTVSRARYRWLWKLKTAQVLDQINESLFKFSSAENQILSNRFRSGPNFKYLQKPLSLID